jgi:hypothetical protein
MPVAPSVALEPVARPRPSAAPAYRGALSEYRSKALLRSHGMSFPEETLARDLDAAQEVAERLGYPVVLKASGGGIWHKSDHRLLELAIGSSAELCAAWRRLERRVTEVPSVELDGFLVARYIDGGLEAFLGFSRDPEFGPIAILGPGGVHAELYGPGAMCHLPLPLTKEALEESLETSLLARLARGYRGGLACDFAAFVDFVVDAARIVAELGPGLKELDLNPVKIRPVGLGAWPLDALCVFDPA